MSRRRKKYVYVVEQLIYIVGELYFSEIAPAYNFDVEADGRARTMTVAGRGARGGFLFWFLFHVSSITIDPDRPWPIEDTTEDRDRSSVTKG